MSDPCSDTGARSSERALQRLVAAIRDGLQHGYFEYTVSCEMIGHGRRQLQIRAGKNYQFVIPAEECEFVSHSSDLR